MLVRRYLLALLGLWVGLGVVLAPAGPMPGMALGTVPSTAGVQAHAMPMATRSLDTGHMGQKHAPEPEHSSHEHLLRCVLCVVGAGTLAVVVTVVQGVGLIYLHATSALVPPQPVRFRHFRSRAPPLAR